MDKTNKQIIQDFVDQVFNAGNYENIEKYFGQYCPSVFTPHIGLGFQTDISKDKLMIEYVIPSGPSKGKLLAGDEIIRIEEGGQIYDTFESMRDGIWGLGPLGITTKMRVKRDNNLIDLELKVDQINWEILPYTLEQQKRDILSLPKDWKDIKLTINSMVEEGNQIVCIASVSAINLHFKRQAVWGLIWVFEVVGSKITSFWGLGDNVAYLKQVGYNFQPPKTE